MKQSIRLDDLFDKMSEMPEGLLVDVGSGFRELEHISRSVLKDGRLVSGTGEIMILLRGDKDNMTFPSDKIVTISK